MGDMKTPDFDDLLAAFDIPDMVDPKAAIESAHEDNGSQNKLSNTAAQDEVTNTLGHDVSTSVIVKNARNKENKGHLLNQTHPAANQNGHLNGCPKDIGPIAPKCTSAMVNQFSPISSAEEFEEDEKIDVEDSVDNQGTQSSNRLTSTMEHEYPKISVTMENLSKCRHQSDLKLDQNNNKSSDSTKESKHEKETQKAVPKPKELMQHKEDAQNKSSSKLSSCIAAIAALDAQKAHEDSRNVDFSESLPDTPQKDENSTESPCRKTDNNESAHEAPKKWLTKLPDSPSSITSEGSPASSTDTNQVIPRVRIKTIKTLSGQIKRTVTPVLPELELEGFKKNEICKSPTFIGTTSAIFTSPRHSLSTSSSVANTCGLANEVTKQMTMKPVATAFLPVSAVKTAGSQVINLKLANNTTFKATVIPASSVQSTSSAILKAANAQAVVVPASSLVNAKLVPNTVHLGNLNLVPQAITSSGQSSKKIPKVQVFGSSQSSVVDAFNKVLSSMNPLPVYVPNLCPPSAACITLPSRGYSCLECGDSFALEKSLDQHYERRSVRIEVICNHCAKTLVFYNKCSLLSHARVHKDKGAVMQCSHLILKPIPTDQMITTTSPPYRAHTNSISHTQVTSEQDDTSKVGRQNLKCFECNEMFQNGNSLAMHYQQTSKSTGQKTCTVCQMLLPNQCSFLSHQRIHQQKSPYTCPECGVSCQSAHIQSHVTINCLHYTRRHGYRCIHCSVVFSDAAALKSHIQNAHCEIFYKCPICPMAFKSAPGTHSHTYTQHPGVKAGEPKLIHKCSMCDTVFTLQSLLYTHLEQHVNSQKMSVFKCSDCSAYYAQKQLLWDHIKETHGTLKTIESPTNGNTVFPLGKKSANSNSPCTSTSHSYKDSGNENFLDRPEKKPALNKTNSPKEVKSTESTGYTCPECNTVFGTRETYVGHMRREHGKILKKHPCRQCEKSFSSTHSLCRHNRLKHKGVRKVYTCPHCPALNQPFTKRVLLDQHIQLMHEDQEEKIISDMETQSDKEMTTFPKRKSEENEGSPGGNCRGPDLQPLKKLKANIIKVSLIKIHKCAVCGLTTENISSFHEHIPQHKSDGSSYQCKECGLCYTSPRSLARHLFIVHRLKEPQGLGRYQRHGKGEGESQRENQLNSLDENNDGAPNTTCKVCGKDFETEANLNTHMRTHGMAFIKAKEQKAKRLSAAEK